jgi:ParB family transcriptional regulator, chromosome partitioning protein
MSGFLESQKIPPNPAAPKRGLGRGLGALFQEVQQQGGQLEASPVSALNALGRMISIEKVSANPEQPRKHFDDARLKELADSIAEQGLVQPIVVKKVGEDKYQIIAGERRWRASQLAGLKEIPAFIRDEKHDKLDNDLASLVENIQREELNPIELAQAYQRLLSGSAMTQDALSKKLGVSRVAVANTLRLLKLPTSVQDLLVTKKLSEGHARALLSLDLEADIETLATRTITESLSVRQLEQTIKLKTHPELPLPVSGSLSLPQLPTSFPAEAATKDPELLQIEEDLRQIFGAKVTVKGNGVRGMIELYYSGSDSLNRLLHLLKSVNK